MEFDDFDDDELDELTDGALRELEQQAILATQAQATQAPAQRTYNPGIQSTSYLPAASQYQYRQPSRLPANAALKPGVNAPFRPPIAQNATMRPPAVQIQTRPIAPSLNPSRPQASQYQRQPTQFNRPTAASQSVRQSAKPAASQGVNYYRNVNRPTATLSQVNPPFVPPRASQTSVPYRIHDAQSGSQCAAAGNTSKEFPDDVVHLKARLEHLTQLLGKTQGETSILRSNIARLEKTHAESMQAIRLRHEAQLNTFKSTLDAAQNAEKAAQTELKFLQQEARDAATRARTVGFNNNTTTGGPDTGPSTPRKTTKTWKMADGFDDIDLAPSPRKGGRTVSTSTLERTPTKNKRKRPIMDSPVPQLDTDDVFMVGMDDEPADPNIGNTVLPATSTKPQLVVPVPSFDYVKILLDHQPQPLMTTLQALYLTALPSNPSQTLAANIMHRLPQMESKTQPLQVLSDFTNHLGVLLATCVDENYTEPFAPLATLIAFTLRLHSWSIISPILPSLVPTITSGLTVLLTQRRTPESTAGAGALLSLLHLVALVVSPASDRPDKPSGANRRCFWGLMTRDLITLCLSPKYAMQPEIISMLQILSMSSTERSIGPIGADISSKEVATFILGYVSKVLEVSTLNSFGADMSMEDEVKAIRQLQTEALRTLESFARYQFGKRAILQEVVVLPRVAFVFINAVSNLYSLGGRSSCVVSLSSTSTSTSTLTPKILGFGSSEFTILSSLVATCVSVFYSVVTTKDLEEGPDGIPRFFLHKRLGFQRDLSDGVIISLGRISSIGEEAFYEDCIDATTSEQASYVLEMVCSTKEYNATNAAFGGVTEYSDKDEAMQDEVDHSMAATSQGGGMIHQVQMRSGPAAYNTARGVGDVMDGVDQVEVVDDEDVHVIEID